MANISREKIEMITNKADIVSIISSYLKLSKKGRNFWGVCPFHPDSEPSMSVSPEKKIFKCFSCGAAGNAIDFVKDIERIDFLSALKKVSDSAGVELGELSNHAVKDKYSKEQRLIIKINEEANNFFKGMLHTEIGKEALKYIQDRKISNESIRKFEIGYASSKVKLSEKLLEKGYTKQEIELAGLGTVYDLEVRDYFVNRVIFPIRNEDNHVIGFSARTMTDEKPKYINSRESLVFKKSQLAYNIQNVAKTANFKKEIIVLEGFMDVISLDQVEIDNAIAIMGTAFSDYHVKLFKNINVKVKLFLDGDNAGINATVKAAKKLIDNKIDTLVIDNETESDPDELINQGKVELVNELILKATHPINFVINKLWKRVDINNPDSVNKYIVSIKDFVQGVSNPILIEQAIKKISKLTNINEDIVRQLFGAKPQKVVDKQFEKEFIPDNPSVYEPGPQYIPEDIPPIHNVVVEDTKAYRIDKAYRRAEQRVFVSLLKSDEFIEKIDKNKDLIIDSNLRSAIRGIIGEYRKGNYLGNNVTKILELVSDRTMHYRTEIDQIISDPLVNIAMTEKEIDDSFKLLSRFEGERQIKELEIRMNNADDIKEKIRIMNNINLLRKNLNSK
ncbi:DNA primase [[Acholeplasma] multilocale]|uniref:DNA primase n=1 Tax=[Acholeplasma] multilocale TaxID=264638 RepID=UPI00047EE787|nr:DNA primase [[Acholeplasma] multilocale]